MVIAREIYTKKSASHLSSVALFFNWMKTMFRIYTTLEEVGDNMILFMHICGFIVYSILLVLYCKFRNRPVETGYNGGTIKVKQSVMSRCWVN